MDSSINNLKEKAVLAATKAYAPYSNFKVGCALMTSTGNTYTGCNVENASYGLTICAERNAIAKAVSNEGKIKIKHIVIYTPTNKPTPPCGACRQVIHEFGNPEVYSFCETSKSTKHLLSELLPHAFKLDES